MTKGGRRLFETLCVIALIQAGCQMAPTRTGGSQRREFSLLVDKTARAAIDLDENTVVLDARPPFDYGLNRVQGSLNMTWDALAESAASGEVLRDKRKAALKLALNGLTPQTPVVVVGGGARGQGEEGRLAWTLLLLGFQDVQVAGLEVFRNAWTQAPSPPPKNVDLYALSPRADLEISRDEFAKLALNPKGRLAARAFLIDVRSQEEYFNQANTKTAPDVGALHVPWNEFYTRLGRPDPGIKAKLAAVGVKPEDRVILVSNKGVRSGAAAYALLALGFGRVQNFTGGWNSYLK